MNTLAAFKRGAMSASRLEYFRNRKSKLSRRKVVKSTPEEPRRHRISRSASRGSRTVASLGHVVAHDLESHGLSHECSQAAASEGVAHSSFDKDNHWVDHVYTETAQDVVGERKAARILDLAQQETLRARRYATFETVDLEDLTDGLVRIVIASDGVNPTCASLLLTLSFAEKLQAVLLAQRDLEWQEELTARQDGVSLRFQARLRSRIASKRYQLNACERDQPLQVERQASIKEALRRLDMLLERQKSAVQRRKAVLATKVSNVRKKQAAVNAFLEEAFVFAGLLDAEEDGPMPTFEELDVQEEYDKLCEELDVAAEDAGKRPVALDNGSDLMGAPPPTAEELARRALVDEVWSAHGRLMRAQDSFDWKEYDRDRDWPDHSDYMERAIESEREPRREETQEHFDLDWLLRFRLITRELIDAEKAFAMVNARALAAGIGIFQQQESASTDSTYSGSERIDADVMIRERGGTVLFDRELRVERWVTGVSSTASSGCGGVPPPNEELKRLDDIALAESWSVVAQGSERKRIEEWRVLCDLEVEEHFEALEHEDRSSAA